VKFAEVLEFKFDSCHHTPSPSSISSQRQRTKLVTNAGRTQYNIA